VYTGEWNRPKDIEEKKLKEVIVKWELYQLLPYISVAHAIDENPTFELIFNTTVYSDISIIVEDKKILAHKVILSLRNPVFKAMFGINYKESTQREITLKEFQYDIIFNFIKFIYTDKCDNITEDNVIQLFQCCHQYQEKVLLNRCEIFIANGLTIENVCDIYQFSSQFNATELKNKCLTFISYRYNTVTQTNGFNDLQLSDKQLMENQKVDGIYIEEESVNPKSIPPKLSFFSRFIKHK